MLACTRSICLLHLVGATKTQSSLRILSRASVGSTSLSVALSLRAIRLGFGFAAVAPGAASPASGGGGASPGGAASLGAVGGGAISLGGGGEVSAPGVDGGPPAGTIEVSGTPLSESCAKTGLASSPESAATIAAAPTS